MKRRIISLILVISMLSSLVQTSVVFADDEYVTDTISETLDLSDSNNNETEKSNETDFVADEFIQVEDEENCELLEDTTKEDDYSTWKKQKVADMNNDKATMKLFALKGLASNQIANDYLSLCVQNGTYSYNTKEGNPDSETDNNKLLLYDGTSQTIISIDDNIYRFASHNTEANENGDSIVSYAEYDDISIEQIFSFAYNTYTKRNDTVEFKYVFTNNSSEEKSIGSRIFFDIMLADNDWAPFKVPGYGDITYETEFLKDDLLQVWQSFDNLRNPTVIASGKLYDNVSEKPSKIQFLNWENGCDTIWDCPIDKERQIEDTAVNIYFDPIIVKPGESRTIKTYYGLSSLRSGNNINMGLSAFAPTELIKNQTGDNYISSLFTLNGFVDNKTGGTLTGVKATINLPAELSTEDNITVELGDIESNANKPVAWNISALPQYKDSDVEYQVTLSANEVPDEATSFYIYLPRLKDDYGNNTDEEIGVLTEGQDLKGKFEIYEDVDVFSFTPTENGVYSFESVSQICPKAILFNKNGRKNTIKEDIFSGTDNNFYIVAELEKEKTYYLEIMLNDTNSTGQYSVCVNKLTDDVGNTYASSKEIEVKTEYVGIINYPCDVDIYQLEAQKSGYCSAVVSGEFSSIVELYDASGNILATSKEGEQLSSAISYNLVNGQKYYFSVKHNGDGDKDSAEIGTYSFLVAYDETPPVVNSLVSDEKSKYNKSFDVKVSASDNVAVDTISLKYSYNGIEWQTLDTKNWNNNVEFVTFSVDTTSFTDGVVYLCAEATDISGNKSENSQIKSYIVDNTAPGQVDVSSAISTIGANYLSWKKASESDAVGYIIYRSSNNGNTFDRIVDTEDVNTLFYVDTNVTTGATYIYKVVAYDDINQESLPVTKTITTLNDTQSDEAIKNISVVPERTSFFVGESARLNAKIEYINGETKDASNILTYDISDKNVISVDASGTVKALNGGNSTLSVTVGNTKIEIPFVIKSIMVSISSNTIVESEKVQISVKNYTLQGVEDVTSKAKYTVNNNDVVSVNASGEVTALTTGQATITAEYNNQKENVTVTVYSRPGKITETNIKNNSESLPVRKMLTWISTKNTDKYNVYIWKNGETKPDRAVASNLINTMYEMRLEYNTKYCLQIESINQYAVTLSDVFEFSTIGLPDLECISVKAPDEVFSESSMLVSWEIKNSGTKSTDSEQWYDYIYLSPSAEFDYNTAVLLGIKANYSYLEAGEGYRNEESFVVPRGTIGKYYIFVLADYGYNIYELNESNNIGKSSAIDVKLCPQPDLKIDKVNTSLSNIISGNQITVSYNSENIGNEIPAEPFIGGWIDGIYFSKDKVLSNEDIQLASIPVTVYSGSQDINTDEHIFYKDKKYYVSKTVTIPQNIFGEYYIIVKTDSSDFVYENDDFNNVCEAKINVTLDPPADIVPVKIDIPSEMVSAGKYTLKWKDVNEGSRDISGEYWTDRIYIDKNNTFNAETATLLKTISGVKENDINSIEISLPPNLEGQYYLYIVSDYAHRIFEYNTYDNNIISFDEQIIMRELPDLFVKSISLPSNLRANEYFDINYTIENIEDGSTVEYSWNDEIYISESEVFDDSARRLGTFSHYGNIMPSDEYTSSVSVKIPSDITGRSYIFVKTNANRQVVESGNDSNNVSSGYIADVLSRFESDLRVTDARTTGISTETGAILPIKWMVTNFGPDKTANSWYDSIYLSTSPLSPYSGMLLGKIHHNGALDKKDSYTVEKNFVLSGRLNGTYYIYVVTDADNDVYENANENNNFRLVDIVTLVNEQEVVTENIDIVLTKQSDIAVTSVNAPQTAEAGKEAEIIWTVKNVSDEVTSSSSWTDSVYIIREGETDYSNGIKLKTQSHTGALNAGEEYAGSIKIKLPYDLSGSYKIVVVTDEYGRIIETDRENNVYAASESTVISSAKAVDLSVEIDDLSEKVTAGQPLTLSWKVENNGEANAEGKWYDAVYLSYTETTYDIKLAETLNPKELPIGESYIQTATVDLPTDITGPMYIRVKANSYSQDLYELNFDNNVGTKATELTEMNCVDLTVGNISIPSVAYPGEDITVGWDVVNLSTSPLNANMTDNIYISADDKWDIEDIPVGELTRKVSMEGSAKSYETLTVAMPDYEALSKLRSSLTDTMPGVQEGHYYVVVRTDVKNQVNENNKANNRVSSSSTLDASVPKIEIGEIKNGTLQNSSEKYYRFSSNGNDSFNIGLNCDNNDAVNEMYVSYNKVPTANNYDYKFTQAMSSDQSVTVPVSQKGEYYIYVKNISTANSETGYDLSVKQLEYGVSDVYPKSSAQGKVTIKLSGALLESNIKATLKKGKVKINAEKIYYFDSSNVYATFDMSYAGYGVYSLTVDCGGNICELPDCFTVENSSLGELKVSMSAPTSYQLNSVGSGTIRYKNVGNTDIAAPILVVQADNVMLKGSDDAEFSYEPMTFYANNSEGPAGILAPGDEGAYNFAFKATDTGDAIYNIFAYDQIDDLGFEKSDITTESNVDDIASSIIQKAIGKTGKSYTEALSDIASYYSQFGFRTNNPDELIMLLSQSVFGDYTNTAVSAMQDMTIFAGGFEDVLERQYFSGLAERSEKSIFGYGWKTQFEGAAVCEDGFIVITYPNGLRIFEQSEGTGYKEISGNASAKISGGEITVTERNGSKTVYGTNGKIKSSESLSGDMVTVSYNGNKITKIDYPNAFIKFEYDGDYVSKITGSDGKEVTYGYDGNYLVSVTTEKGTVEYEYDRSSVGAKRNALVKVNYIDGTSMSYQYDNNGRLSKEQGTSGVGAKSYQYGVGGEVTVTDAFGNTQKIYFDQNGMTARVIDPNGICTESKISEDGKSGEMTQALFARNLYKYNDFGDVVSYTNPLGYSIDIEYDEFGNVVSLIDEKGAKTKYSYNKNRLESITYSDGTKERYEYDSAGRTTLYTDRNGGNISYSYDSDGNLIKKDYSDGNSVSYTYDSDGNIAKIADSTGDTLLEYDSMKNVTKVTYGDGRSVGYEYDSIGRRTKIVDNENVGTNYSYDGLGRLAEITDDNDNRIVAYTYDKLSRVTKKENANGTYTTYSYTPSGDISKLVNYNPQGGINSQFVYSYDKFGNISSIKTNEGVYTYEYDLMKQLVSATEPDGTVTRYSYDATGNRISEQVGREITYYSTNELNQYTKVGNIRYSYDAAGNLITKTDENGVTTYSYDLEGNLVNITSPLGIWEYCYNALGQRVSASNDGAVTNYLYDISGLGNVIAEYNGADTTKYIHGLGLEAMRKAGLDYFYDFNMQGSVIGLTNAAGQYVNRYSYSPDGNVNVISEAVKNPFRYSGRFGIMDDGNGLNYIRARYYDPDTGKFIALDSYGQKISTNGYKYSNNNAIYYVDEDGNIIVTAAMATVIIGGAVIGAAWSAATSYASGERGWDVGVKAISGGLSGALGGALSFTGIGAAAIPFITSATGSAINQVYAYSSGKKTAGEAVGDFAFDTIVGGIVGNLVDKTVGSALKKFFPSDKWRLMHQIKSWNSILNGKTVGNKIAQTLFKKPFSKWGKDIIKGLWQWLMSIFGSADPNDIIGPASYGDANWISSNANLDYTIRFENDPEFATAPVQYLSVTQKLDENLDLRTFRLGSFGFGGQIFNVPDNKALYQTRLDLTEEMGIFVDVWAGIDIVNGVATWTFTAIDPETGEKPTNPLIGFLPVNDKETGNGEGFAAYTVKPKNDISNGEVINAVATIIFDNNAPIDTPEIFNTVDSVNPVSELTNVSRLSDGETLIEWNADDNSDGSGYGSAEVYVSVDMTPFVLAMMVANEKKAIYNTEPNKKYEFFVRATDNAGNYEAMKQESEKGIDNGFEMQKTEKPHASNIFGNTNEGSQFIELTTATEGASIFYTLDGEVPTTESVKYTERLVVSDGTVIKAIAVKPGMYQSDIMTYRTEEFKKLTVSEGSNYEIDGDKAILSGVSDKTTVAQIKSEFDNQNITILNSKGEIIDDTNLVGTGSVVQLKDGDDVIDECTVVVKGDISGDGKVNVSDLIGVFNHIQDDSLTGVYYDAALINSDKKVNISDLVMLFNMIQG